MKIKVRAPGKLILSGEHAVLYGAPALAFAVDYFSDVIVSKQDKPLISFALANLNEQKQFSHAELLHLTSTLKTHYADFLLGHRPVQAILKTKELAFFTAGLLADHFIHQGAHIELTSHVPMKSGMGSSAATIVSILYALVHYLALDWPITTLQDMALIAENMQHGQSSGLDIHLALHGGFVHFQNKITQARKLPLLPMYLVNTGMAVTSTGECCMAAAAHFADRSIVDDFIAVTETLDTALKADNVPLHTIKAAIAANHQLLVRVGVVPQKVQHFISALGETGAVAKICGAGASRGDHAGMVLVLTESPAQVLAPYCEKYGFNLLPITPTQQGVHRVYL